jgi:hypothetical protein
LLKQQEMKWMRTLNLKCRCHFCAIDKISGALPDAETLNPKNWPEQTVDEAD